MIWPVLGRYRVYRGGSWRSGLLYARVAYRYNVAPSLRSINHGARLVRNAEVMRTVESSQIRRFLTRDGSRALIIGGSHRVSGVDWNRKQQIPNFYCSLCPEITYVSFRLTKIGEAHGA